MHDPELEAAKRRSTLQVLLRAARLLDETALARLRARSGVELRPAHTALFPHIDLEGTRQTVLAERLGVTKQAVGQRVAELVAAGVLELAPDPSDGRARLVRFVGGTQGLLHGLRILGELEDELAAAIGPDRWATFREVLLEVHDRVDRRTDRS